MASHCSQATPLVTGVLSAPLRASRVALLPSARPFPAFSRPCGPLRTVDAPLARRAVAIRAGRAVGSNDASPRAVRSHKSDVAAPRESSPRAAVGVDCGDVASASHASPRGRIVFAFAGALVAIHLAAAASPLEAVAAAFNAAHPWVEAAEQSPYARAQEDQAQLLWQGVPAMCCAVCVLPQP
ncbi:unnamed protein product, partial [Closterium sp. Naga37s-1]